MEAREWLKKTVLRELMESYAAPLREQIKELEAENTRLKEGLLEAELKEMREKGLIG